MSARAPSDSAVRNAADLLQRAFAAEREALYSDESLGSQAHLLASDINEASSRMAGAVSSMLARRARRRGGR